MRCDTSQTCPISTALCNTLAAIARQDFPQHKKKRFLQWKPWPTRLLYLQCGTPASHMSKSKIVCIGIKTDKNRIGRLKILLFFTILEIRYYFLFLLWPLKHPRMCKRCIKRKNPSMILKTIMVHPRSILKRIYAASRKKS